MVVTMLFSTELMAKFLAIRVAYQTIFGTTVVAMPTLTEEPKLFATIRLQHIIIFNLLFPIAKPVLDLFVSVPPQLVAV